MNPSPLCGIANPQPVSFQGTWLNVKLSPFWGQLVKWGMCQIQDHGAEGSGHMWLQVPAFLLGSALGLG